MTGPTRPCPHTPRCPGAEAPDRDAARVVADRPEQDWVLLCNGVVRIDGWELLPDGTSTPDPVSSEARHREITAA